LALQLGSLLHQVAAMPGQELQLPVDLVPRGLQQSKTIDGGAKNAFQVVVVGLDVGARGQAIMPRCEGMHQPGFAAGLAKRALGVAMVDAGHLDGHHVVLNAVLPDGFAKLQRGLFQRGALMFDDGGRNEHIAVEIAEHPFGLGLGAIDGHDAESFRANVLDAGLNDAPGLAQYGRTDCAGFARIAFCSHSNCLLSWEKG
jgi:hypothetical protein